MMKRETNAEKNREKVKTQREAWLVKKEEKINRMSEDELITVLKAKGMPSFGTKSERSDRLKKHFGINPQGHNARAKVLTEIEKIKMKREVRRAEIKRKRDKKINRELENKAEGKLGDVEFEEMIENKKYKVHKLCDHLTSENMKLCVCVRKRPIFQKEFSAGENDCISVANPELKIFTPKFKVDGITKYLEETLFRFDNTFNENQTTEEIYNSSVQPIIEGIFKKGMVTLFAYGQTSSGKTFTMQGIQEISVRTIFKLHRNKYPEYSLFLSFYEIYGGRCFDLLNKKSKVQILEGMDN